MTNPIRPSKATPAEQEQLLAGAKAALAKGWFVFAAPYKSKAAYEGTHGSKDASRPGARTPTGSVTSGLIRRSGSRSGDTPSHQASGSCPRTKAWPS